MQLTGISYDKSKTNNHCHSGGNTHFEGKRETIRKKKKRLRTKLDFHMLSNNRFERHANFVSAIHDFPAIYTQIFRNKKNLL